MRIIAFVLLFTLWLPACAQADIFVWEDPESGMSLSFPDTWSVLNNQAPDDIIVVKAPSVADGAMCRVCTRPDARYLIYPPRYSSSVQKDAYSEAFWKTYLNGSYSDVVIHRLKDQAGLGRGYAGHVLASFNTIGDEAEHRTALGYVSLYNDTAYILECSSLAGAFENWTGMLQSIAGSVDFAKAHHELATGEYEDFLNE